ncbi:MAG: 50S ribosomal protein L23 [Patescibacteria group bacterium]
MKWWEKIWGKRKKKEEKKEEKPEEIKKEEIKIAASLDKNYFLVPLISEKSIQLAKERNVYTFLVDHRLNKNKIKELIGKLFNVKIKKVNTANYSKRIRAKSITIKRKRPRFKKALVFLEQGQKIPIFE